MGRAFDVALMSRRQFELQLSALPIDEKPDRYIETQCEAISGDRSERISNLYRGPRVLGGIAIDDLSNLALRRSMSSRHNNLGRFIDTRVRRSRLMNHGRGQMAVCRVTHCCLSH